MLTRFENWAFSMLNPANWSNPRVKVTESQLVRDGSVYSAPACVFFSGEHAVMYGHPAIYFPLPCRLYLTAKAVSGASTISFKSFNVNDPQKPGKLVDLNSHDLYSRGVGAREVLKLNNFFEKVVFPSARKNLVLKNKLTIEIHITSEFPIACGMNSSGAISACLAMFLVDEYLDLSIFRRKNRLKDVDQNKLIESLAWMIENCFHSQKGSGVGSSVALSGRAGYRPVTYFTEKRSLLKTRTESKKWRSVETPLNSNGFRSIVNTKRFLFDPNKKSIGANAGYPTPPEFALTVLFSGIVSKTADVLEGGVRQLDDSILDIVDSVQNEIDGVMGEGDMHNSIRFHVEHIVKGVFRGEGKNRPKKLSQAFHELVCGSIGRISVLMMNSILHDWRLVPQMMRTTQTLLDSAEVTNARIREVVNYTLDKCKRSDLGCESAVKVTGSGGGGCLVFFTLVDQCDNGNTAKDPSAKKKVRIRHKRLANTVSFWKKAPVVFSSLNYKSGELDDDMRVVPGARRETQI